MLEFTFQVKELEGDMKPPFQFNKNSSILIYSTIGIIEEDVLDTNTQKQLFQTATDVKLTPVLKK